MITVSRLDGTEIVVNAELIQFVETTPDTVLSMLDGRKLVVRESSDEVVERVIAYRQNAYAPWRSLTSAGNSRAAQE
jgi:flagellar protein FlbD